MDSWLILGEEMEAVPKPIVNPQKP
jgi:hypothetical protein